MKITKEIEELRSYGMSNSCTPVGAPRIRKSGEKRTAPTKDIECPHCKCEQLFEIEVDVEGPYLNGGAGVGYYMGCAACPWASPMIAIATNSAKSEA
jgi:hypothetical protein